MPAPRRQGVPAPAQRGHSPPPVSKLGVPCRMTKCRKRGEAFIFTVPDNSPLRNWTYLQAQAVSGSGAPRGPASGDGRGLGRAAHVSGGAYTPPPRPLTCAHGRQGTALPGWHDSGSTPSQGTVLGFGLNSLCGAGRGQLIYDSLSS